MIPPTKRAAAVAAAVTAATAAVAQKSQDMVAWSPSIQLGHLLLRNILKRLQVPGRRVTPMRASRSRSPAMRRDKEMEASPTPHEITKGTYWGLYSHVSGWIDECFVVFIFFVFVFGTCFFSLSSVLTCFFFFFYCSFSFLCFPQAEATRRKTTDYYDQIRKEEDELKNEQNDMIIQEKREKRVSPTSRRNVEPTSSDARASNEKKNDGAVDFF